VSDPRIEQLLEEGNALRREALAGSRAGGVLIVTLVAYVAWMIIRYRY